MNVSDMTVYVAMMQRLQRSTVFACLFNELAIHYSMAIHKYV